MKSHLNQSCTVTCQNCSLSSLCIPFTLNHDELDKLDDIIERKKPYHKGDKLHLADEPLHALFAVRSGSFKSFTISESGNEQITAFHLPGDIIGFDALGQQSYRSYAQALETAMVCEIPYTTLDQLTGTMPRLRQQVMRLMSDEISTDQQMFLLLNQKSAEERLASFIGSLSSRFSQRGLSATQFRLSMTRGEIGNYLGLTVETISRLLGKFQKDGIIAVDGKFITILNSDKLSACSQN